MWQHSIEAEVAPTAMDIKVIIDRHKHPRHVDFRMVSQRNGNENQRQEPRKGDTIDLTAIQGPQAYLRMERLQDWSPNVGHSREDLVLVGY